MKDYSANNKRILKNTIFLYVRMLLIMVVSLYTSRIVLQALGVVDFGVYNVVGGMVSMFIFLNTALAQATQRFIALGIDKDSVKIQQNTFSMLMNVHILISAVIFLLCETIGLWLFFNELVIPDDRLFAAFWVMQFSIVSLILTIIQVPYNASIFGHEKMNVYALVGIVEVLLKLLAVIIIKNYFSDKLLVYGLLILIVQVIIFLSYQTYCRIKLPNCRFHLFWSKGIFKKIFNFTSWSLLGNLAFTLNGQGMNFLINIFFGPVYNATKGIATAVEHAVSNFSNNFIGAVIPQIIKSYGSGDIPYMMSLHYRSGKIAFMLFMTISIPLMTVIRPILKLWLVSPPPMSDIFCVLTLIFIQCNTMAGTIQNVIQAVGEVKVYQITYGSIRLLALPIAYISYKLGAPITTYLYILIFISLVSLVGQLLSAKYVMPQYSIKGYFKDVVLRELLAYSIPFFVFTRFFGIDYNIPRMLLIIFIMVVICLISSFMIGLTKQERKWALAYFSIKFKNKL